MATSGSDLIALDLSGCLVDAVEIDRAMQTGIREITRERLAELCDLFGGDLLESVEIDGNPEFTGWLAAQRHRYRAMHITLLAELVARPLELEETFRRLDAWLQLAPFDERAHQAMLVTLAKSGRVLDAEEHLAKTIRSFEREGLDWSQLRQAWHAARTASAEAARIQAAAAPAVPANAEPLAAGEDRSPRRASVAVMPFVDRTSVPGEVRKVADGLTEDIITRLAKLRVMFVIARGTVYALGERGVGAQEAGRILNVEYVVSGSVRRHDARIAVVVELAETRDARIVWTDEFVAAEGDTFAVLDSIVHRIVAAIAAEIETAETSRAILKPPSSLDAWEAYHRGLWHMYKFDAPNNQHAEHFFRGALKLDPTFSRAYAGLSFTHFQNAFLDLTQDREQQIELAWKAAGQSLGADDRDPAAHWAMGRALWLRGVQDESLSELQRSIELSPNFALGHYTLGFVQSQQGDPRSAIEATNYSRQLSPFDPLQFAMLASRAIAHARLGEVDEAADWAVKATGRPNAHAHILAIAVQCLALANRRDEAQKFVARLRERQPSYSVADFLRAFHFDRDTEELFRQSAKQIGFDSAP